MTQLSRSELQKVYAEKARTIGKSAKSAMAEQIVEMIEPNRLTTDTVKLFMRFENLNVGDTIKRTVRKGKYITRNFVPGQDLITEKMPNPQEKYLFLNDWLYAGASADMWAIESGDVDSVQQMKSDLGADITEGLAYTAYNLLGSAWSAGATPNNYVDATATGVTATTLDTVIETIIDEVGQVNAIIGTRKALLPIYKFARTVEVSNSVGATPNPLSTIIPTAAFQEYENTIRVSQYHGINLIELPNTRRQRLPNLKEKVVPTDKVLVVGDFPGTFYQYGGIEYQDNTDTSRIPSVYNVYAWVRYAVLLDALESIGVIKVAAS